MQRRSFIQSGALAPFLSLAELTRNPIERSFGNAAVINAGVGGNNTADLLARIHMDCISYRPALTVLMVGTNDMNSRKYIPLQDYARNLQLLIDKLKMANSRILLMNLLPVYEPYLLTRHSPDFYKPEGHSGRLTQMNMRIADLAANNNIGCIDLHHIFISIGNIGLDKSSLIKNEANSSAQDGLHPTADGYRVIALSVYQAILRLALPVNSIVCFGDSITLGDGIDGGYNYPSYLKKLLS